MTKRKRVDFVCTHFLVLKEYNLNHTMFYFQVPWANLVLRPVFQNWLSFSAIDDNHS